jgi:hypothetical protein
MRPPKTEPALKRPHQKESEPRSTSWSTNCSALVPHIHSRPPAVHPSAQYSVDERGSVPDYGSED